MAASGKLLFTILSSLAQEESRNISENTQWSIRSRMKQGTPHLNTSRFMGYDKDEDGHLVRVNWTFRNYGVKVIFSRAFLYEIFIFKFPDIWHNDNWF